MNDRSRVTAVLGPTNTGKTHYAIDRMLAHRTGVIGLPLRLLAREDAGLVVIPPIVVQDELAAGVLIEAAKLEALTETFLAVTRERRFPNPLLAPLLGG